MNNKTKESGEMGQLRLAQKSRKTSWCLSRKSQIFERTMMPLSSLHLSVLTIQKCRPLEVLEVEDAVIQRMKLVHHSSNEETISRWNAEIKSPVHIFFSS